MGFGKKGKSSFTVNRSEEVIPGEIRGVLSRGSSSEADGGPDGLGPNTGADSTGDRFANIYLNYFIFKTKFTYLLIFYFILHFNFVLYFIYFLLIYFWYNNDDKH